MASVILSTSDDLKAKLKRFSWVNWSEVAREEVRKKEIFENYLKTGKISDEEWAYCEEIDWHPVDELPLKEGYAKKLENAKKGPFKTAKKIDFWKE
jgi:hypothetical protein